MTSTTIAPMPKQVDRTARRHRIAEAVWAVIAREGIDAVSLRVVAEEAGISMGAVQHWFPSKSAMVRFACTRMAELAAGEALPAEGGGRPAREEVRAVLVLPLPDTAGARVGARVWAAFVAHALTAPDVAEVIREVWRDGHAHLSAALRAAEADGLLADGVEPDAAARWLYALSDGLVARTLLGDVDVAEATAAIDAALDRVFRG